jgi:ATP-dependent exoDNAse (exonuclease V) beta subunit
VKFAHQYVQHIEAHESAPEGIVRHLTSEETLINTAKPGDAILCRFNAPIITYAYQFIAAGIPAKVEGREIGNGLKNLARRWKVKTFAALQDKLEIYSDREVAKYRAKEQESKAVAVEDRVACLNLLIQRVQNSNPKAANPIDALCEEIDKIFADDVGAEHVIMSSIHKAKGREFDRVFIINSGIISKWARKEWELQQEQNLQYVAATRAKKELILA